MRWPAAHGAQRRDEMLAQTRRASAWVAGGAAAASLGLGVAFAHAIPGHGAPPASGSGGQASGQPGPGGPGGSGAGQPSGGRSAPHARRRLAAAPPPAAHSGPPVVTSGGS